MKLELFSTEQLINCLPENRPLYKDSGLWSIYDDDFEREYISQRVNETFKEFLIRYITAEIRNRNNDTIKINLALSNV